ncbi:MAG: hypothetical protein MUE69_20115 [Myxococcota bacterium]|jgi:hypothetical protein|nr:hypothetical protein [Myxococcota bacterium]
MAFRDDRDALRARKEQLEKDLTDAQQALERHERKDEHDERELARLRREVDRLRVAAGEASANRPPRVNKTPFLAAGVAGTVAVTAAIGFFVSMRAAPVAPIVAPPVPTVPGMPLTSPPVSPTSPPAVVPRTSVRFGALVTSSDGRPEIPVGAGCVVETELTGERVASLRVQCLGVAVYDPTWEVGTSMTMSSSGARARSTAEGEVFLVEYSEVGQRTGPRPQIAFDSQRSTLRVWAENASPFDLRFVVDERGLPDVAREPATQAPHARWRVEARRRASRGVVPFTTDRCELSLFPEALDANHTCRAQLRCEDVLVYGGATSGYNRCETVIADAQAYPRANDTGVSSEDSDPRFALDLAEKTLVVADATPTGAWEASFTLRDSTACDFDGAWVGTLDGAPLRLQGERGRFVGAVVGEAMSERCAHGEAAIELDGRRFEGRFGPGFASFLAVDAEGTPLTLLRVAP